MYVHTDTQRHTPFIRVYVLIKYGIYIPYHFLSSYVRNSGNNMLRRKKKQFQTSFRTGVGKLDSLKKNDEVIYTGLDS